MGRNKNGPVTVLYREPVSTAALLERRIAQGEGEYATLMQTGNQFRAGCIAHVVAKYREALQRELAKGVVARPPDGPARGRSNQARCSGASTRRWRSRSRRSRASRTHPKPLGCAGCAEAFHGAFALPGRLVRVFRPVVQVLRLPVLDRRHHLPMRHRVIAELVGDQHPRRRALLLEEFAEEPLGGLGVAPAPRRGCRGRCRAGRRPATDTADGR